jgi:hypothetical protein
MVVLLFYFQVLAAGGKDDSPDLSGRPAISDLFTRLKQLLIGDC